MPEMSIKAVIHYEQTDSNWFAAEDAHKHKRTNSLTIAHISLDSPTPTITANQQGSLALARLKLCLH